MYDINIFYLWTNFYSYQFKKKKLKLWNVIDVYQIKQFNLLT